MNHFMILMFVIGMFFGMNVVAFDMFPCPYNEIIIENSLGPGRVLQYHCFSRDDNIAVANLQFKETKSIKFGDKITKRTIWKCRLKHGLNMRYSSPEFIAYRMGSVRRCGQTRYYYAKTDGIYLNKNQSRPPPIFKHAWNKTK
ncbi:hypothetical protein CARUB_v10006280mg [Capsella rubella]|uniref:S-protein homolog n=1 Tax=Capsella rubella TaxID=81985 RepID=R0F8C5_9BRAS|nr:S-protein homolog 14 [Capsella rubella]EOA17871.1 hypothetical protein CARUB_v10006280mg [Capsella rubella]